MPQAPEITAKSWILVLLGGFIWGGTFLFIELALEGITPFWLAAARIGFAAVLTFFVWRFLGGRLWLSDERDWGALAIVAALSSALPFILLSWGQQYVTSGYAGVSMAAVALIVLPLAHLFVPGERLTRRRAIGFLIGFAGVVVLIGAQAFESTGSAFESLGRLACLGAAACYASSSIIMRRLPPIDSIGLTAILLVIGAAYVIPMAFAIEGLPSTPNTKTLLVLSFLGIVPTAGAAFLRVYVIRTAGPVFMSLTNYQVPVWSVVLGALILGEPLPSSLLLALFLILSGVALSQFGALKKLFGRA